MIRAFLLFFADIDCLKQINDAHGHQEGDLAIIRTAHALQRTFRNSDIVARLGGDEFAVIALEASESTGMRTAFCTAIGRTSSGRSIQINRDTT